VARKSKAQIKREQQTELRQWITAVILLALMIISLMRWGMIGVFLYNFQRYLLGEVFWLILGIIILLIGADLASAHTDGDAVNPVPFVMVICGILLLCSYLGTEKTGLQTFMVYINNISSYFAKGAASINAAGGITGGLLYALCSTLFGRPGVILVIIVLFLIAALLAVSPDVYKNAFGTVAAFFRAPEKEEEPEEEKEPEENKEPANFWNMLEEHKEKKKAKLGSLKPDDEEDTASLDIMNAEENKPAPLPTDDQPHLTKLVNITADRPTEEIPVVSIPGKTISDDSSVFINLSDLEDHIDNDEEIPEDETAEDDNIEAENEEDENEDDSNDFGEEEQEKTVKAASVRRKSGRPYRIPNKREVSSMLDPIPNGDAKIENEAAANEKGDLLISILKNFDIEAELVDTHIGPAVTQFEIRPDVNVKVSRILGLADNIKMALAAKDVRIEAPIPGRNAVGIEVPNLKSTPVKVRELLPDVPEKDQKQPLLVFIGKDLLGRTVTCRLDKMPHLLIAGATGSGKSVCMNSIICSLLLRTHPDDVKMLLIDPKKVEFTPYQKIPHLIGPVINDPAKANNALKAIVQIMDERYNVFASAGVRNIEVFNQKVLQQGGRPNEDGSPAPKKMPYIVVIIDELADLMAVAGKEVEQSVQRITQLARAAGIHLIVATQRPSVDVITGIIKANIPSRIAFAVTSGTDSRTILDHVGAERLLGNGDMLYMPIGQSSSTRVQGVFITDEEVARITKWVSDRGTPMYDDKFVLLDSLDSGDGASIVSVNDDPLYKEVKDYVIEAQKASVSLLQRRFGIGYNRSAKMIDALEQERIIGPAQGSKPRDVYVKPEDDGKHHTETGETD
jgi:S-DNA-T family DNA segregation ATPase FtsK/SpoIIIE